MRGMCAAVLTFEAIVIALAAPVMISVEGVDKLTALTVCLGLAVVCVVTAGMLRKPWAYGLGHAIQVAAVSLGLLVPAMYFVGAMFAALWLGAYLLGRRIADDKARWAAEAAKDSHPDSA